MKPGKVERRGKQGGVEEKEEQWNRTHLSETVLFNLHPVSIHATH